MDGHVSAMDKAEAELWQAIRARVGGEDRDGTRVEDARRVVVSLASLACDPGPTARALRLSRYPSHRAFLPLRSASK